MKLQIGNKAPNFSCKDQNENIVNLTDFVGKKVVIFFYPKANTPGCTAEACDLNNNYERFVSLGYQIIGVSADSVVAQKKFSDKYDFHYPLLADENKEIINAYGVWGPKKFMGREFDGIHRRTFVINENGIIENIIVQVKTKEHTQQILSY